MTPVTLFVVCVCVQLSMATPVEEGQSISPFAESHMHYQSPYLVTPPAGPRPRTSRSPILVPKTQEGGGMIRSKDLNL